jgi:hypothetical protein
MGCLTHPQMLDEAAVADFLAAHGDHGRAIVTRIRAAANQSHVELTLLVVVGDKPPYSTTHRPDRSQIVGVEPGATVRVRVDPVDEHSLIIR